MSLSRWWGWLMEPTEAPQPWQLLSTTAAMGRTRDLVLCCCGQRVLAYRWSWAGHGFKRCPACRRKLGYLSGLCYRGDAPTTTREER
jgi:hypothetical protein